MAKAPRPGSAGTSGGDEKIAAASQKVTITLHHPDRGDIVRTLNLGSVPISERLVVRKATGLPLEAFMAGEDAIGIDTVQVWWWLGCRALNPLTTLEQAVADWPETITADSFTVETGELEADDPEA